MTAPGPVTRRKGSFLGTMRAVAWSFLGIRKRSGLQEDMEQLNPIHIFIAGIGGAVLIVGGLILLVRWVVQP